MWFVHISLSHHHHHHVTLPAQISLTFSHHPSLSSIGKYSRLQPVSAQSCCIKVLTGRPAFIRPCEGVHRSMPLMSSSPRLQQYPPCLVRLTWIVFMMCGWWPYRCFIGCCFKDLFNIASSIFVELPSSF